MTLRIVNETPPNYADLIAVFPFARRPGTYFTYGRAIFIPNPTFGPDGLTVSPWMQKHETVHADRQGRDPAGWWRRYVDDVEFRLAEELEAHRAEFAHFASDNRSLRRRMLRHIAHRLSGPLYGNILTTHKAKRLITGLENPEAI